LVVDLAEVDAGAAPAHDDDDAPSLADATGAGGSQEPVGGAAFPGWAAVAAGRPLD
jgi:hypothetical protein